MRVAEGNRIPELTPTDRIVLEEFALSIKKAALLKEYWASGLSASETSRVFKGQPGYSDRTIDNFWSAFYEAERRDLAREE